MADQITSRESRMRKSSVGTVEMQNPNGSTQVVNLEDLTDADRALAAEFGYKPVFKREFGYLSTFSFAVSISGLFSTVATTFIYPLEAGGSSSAVWCWLISGAGCMCIAVSLVRTTRGVSRVLMQRYSCPFLSWSRLIQPVADCTCACREWYASRY